jgi:hypothetical protein
MVLYQMIIGRYHINLEHNHLFCKVVHQMKPRLKQKPIYFYKEQSCLLNLSYTNNTIIYT